MLRLSNVSKQYKEHTVLNNISFSIKAHEILGLIGPNGAGKTTLMKIIIGLNKQDSGKIECSVVEKGKIGFLIDTPAAYGWLSGYKNLQILSAFYPNIDKNKLNSIIRLVGLQDVIHKKFSKYSLGMKQRLGIAMALLNEPSILVLDEPTNGLDFEGICAMRKMLLDLVKEKDCAVIISSHILDELSKICNSAIFIKDGHIIGQVNEQDIKTFGLEFKYKEIIGVS